MMRLFLILIIKLTSCETTYLSYTHLGCFTDRDTRELSKYETRSTQMTVLFCLNFCSQYQSRYAGVQSGDECRCDDRYNSNGKTSDWDCKDKCSGSWDFECGGSWRNRIYELKYATTTTSTTKATSTSTTSTTRTTSSTSTTRTTTSTTMSTTTRTTSTSTTSSSSASTKSTTTTGTMSSTSTSNTITATSLSLITTMSNTPTADSTSTTSTTLTRTSISTSSIAISISETPISFLPFKPTDYLAPSFSADQTNMEKTSLLPLTFLDSSVVTQTHASFLFKETTTSPKKQEASFPQPNTDSFTFSNSALHFISSFENNNVQTGSILTNNEFSIKTKDPFQLSLNSHTSGSEQLVIDNQTQEKNLSVYYSTSSNKELFATKITQVENLNTTLSYSTTESIKVQDKIDFANMDIVVDLLNLEVDLSDCLSNCSNNGVCKMKIDKTISCSCFEGFAGSGCGLNTNPCSTKQCLNNGQCIQLDPNTLNPKNEFKCNCTRNYYGDKCEYMVDLCLNKTCSSHGTCIYNETAEDVECKCFQYYSGIDCEIESNESKTIKSVIKVASIIAICVLILSYLIFIIIDVWNLFLSKRTPLTLSKEYEPESLKPIYVNN